MGCTDSSLLEPRNTEVNCLVSNGYDEPYTDKLCLFRAIAIHLFGSVVDVELQATEIFHNCVTASDCDPKNFTGVSFDQIPIIGELIKQNISSTMLALKMVKLLENFDAALNNMVKTLNCFDITIISVFLMISTNS